MTRVLFHGEVIICGMGTYSASTDFIEVPPVVEVHFVYDLLPEADNDAYLSWVDRAIKNTMDRSGLVEIRATRNLLGSPLVRVVIAWESLRDWTSYQATDEWRRLDSELRSLIVELRIEIWGVSPILPTPIKPGTKRE